MIEEEEIKEEDLNYMNDLNDPNNRLNKERRSSVIDKLRTVLSRNKDDDKNVRKDNQAPLLRNGNERSNDPESIVLNQMDEQSSDDDDDDDDDSDDNGFNMNGRRGNGFDGIGQPGPDDYTL